MSINVEHNDNQQSQIALQLLLALTHGQPQQGPPQQGGPQQAPQQDPSASPLAQAAAQTNGSAPANYAGGGAGLGSPSVGGSHRAPSYATYDGAYGGGGGSSGGANSAGKYANQDALAQYKNQQTDQRLDQREQQQSDLALQEQLAKPEADLPANITQGLNDGSLRYDPANRKQHADNESAITAVLNNPQWSPAQKAQFIAMRRNENRQLDLTTQNVPVNERPVSPQDQARQSSWQEVDPVSGLTVTKTFGPMRNGSPGPPVLDPVSQAHLKDWQDQQKHNRAAQLKQMELDQKATAAQQVSDAKAAAAIDAHRKWLIHNRQQLLGSVPKSQKEIRDAEAQYSMAFGDARPKDAKGNVIPISQDVLDAASNRLMEARTSHEALLGELDRTHDALGSLGGSASPSDSGQQPPDQSAVPGGYNDMMAADSAAMQQGSSPGDLIGGPPTNDNMPQLSVDVNDNMPTVGDGQPQQQGVTVSSQAELQAALSNPNIPPGTQIIWGPTGKSRAK